MTKTKNSGEQLITVYYIERTERCKYWTNKKCKNAILKLKTFIIKTILDIKKETFCTVFKRIKTFIISLSSTFIITFLCLFGIKKKQHFFNKNLPVKKLNNKKKVKSVQKYFNITLLHVLRSRLKCTNHLQNGQGRYCCL